MGGFDVLNISPNKDGDTQRNESHKSKQRSEYEVEIFHEVFFLIWNDDNTVNACVGVFSFEVAACVPFAVGFPNDGVAFSIQSEEDTEGGHQSR